MKYDYTADGIDNATVDTASPGFLERVQWLLNNSPAKGYSIGEYVGIGIDGNGHARASVTFIGDEGQVTLEAFLLDQHPNVALPEIYSNLAPGQPLPVPLPQYNSVPAPDVDPVGDPWPEKASNIWHTSSQFDPQRWPVGAPFTKRMSDGRDVTFYRTTVRERGSGGGPIASNIIWAPAWTDKPNP